MRDYCRGGHIYSKRKKSVLFCLPLICKGSLQILEPLIEPNFLTPTCVKSAFVLRAIFNGLKKFVHEMSIPLP